MVSAVIFDFYGTLAHPADLGAANGATSYQTIFAAHGYSLNQAVLSDYYSRYDGVEHGEHSKSQEAYEAWVRTRLRHLTESCGVTDPHVETLVDALREVDQSPMVAYPESAATISSLRDLTCWSRIGCCTTSVSAQACHPRLTFTEDGSPNLSRGTHSATTSAHAR